MKNNKKLIIISLCLAFAFIASCLTTPIKALTNIFANTFSEEVSVENGSFNNDDPATVVEGHPSIALPHGWTKSDSASYPETPGDITCATVNDAKELKLYANNNKFGLKHTILTELLADSYYLVSVTIRTDGATASIYLTDDVVYSYEGITTGAANQTHKLYIETKVVEKAELGIELWIGSKETNTTGTVYFDDVKITKVSATEYFEATHNVALLGKCISEKTNITPSNLELNNTTNLATNGWNVKETDNVSDLQASLVKEDEELPIYSKQYNGNTVPIMDTADNKYKLLTEVYKNPSDEYFFDEAFTETEKLPVELQSGIITIGTKYYAGKSFFYLDTANSKIYADYVNNVFTNELPLTLEAGPKTNINGIDHTFTQLANDKYYTDVIVVNKNLNNLYFFTKTNNEVTFPILGGNNDRILKLQNINEDSALTYVSPVIEIEQFGYYKISFYAKSNIEGGDTTSGLTMNYIALIKTGTKPAGEEKVLTTTATPNTINAVTNNWTYYSFYVKGSPISTNTSKLELKINSKSTIYFSNIESTRISSDTYTASTGNKVDLSINAESKSILETDTITNGNFNLATTINFDKTTGSINYPLVPASWTPTGSLVGSNSKAGIVPTSGIYATSGLTTTLNTICPLNSENLNILAIYAQSNSTFGYKSAKFDGTASAIYQLSFDVYTGTNFTGKVYSKAYSSSATIAEFCEITSTTGWATYTYYIKTSAITPTLYIELGITESTGTVFFKNVEIKTSDEITFNEKVVTEDETIIPLSTQRTNKYITIDLDIDNFTAHSFNYSDATNHLYTAYTFTTNENSTGMVGILNTEESFTGTIFEGKTKLNLPTGTSNHILALYNANNEKNVSISQVFGADMSANKYYKLSIWLKTQSIEEGKGLFINFIENTTEEDATPFKIEFTNVNTNGFTDEDSNDYREYSAYIRTGSEAISSMKINIDFGNKTTGLSGYCFISEVSLKESNKTEYNNAKKANKLVDTESTKFVDLKTNKTTPTTKTNTENNDTLSLFFIVFSSVVLVGALIFVIIVIYARKLPKKKKVKKSKNIIGKDGESRRKGGFI